MRWWRLCHAAAISVSLMSCSAEPRQSSSPRESRAEPSSRTGSEISASSIPPRGDLPKEASIERCPRAVDNSPSTFDADSGTYAVLITDFRAPDSLLTFDVVQWTSGEQALQAFEQDTGDSVGPPNDYYLRNESTKTRSAPLAPEARLFLTHFWSGDAIDLEPAQVRELPSYLKSMGGRALFWLTFQGGRIIEACEQWTP